MGIGERGKKEKVEGCEGRREGRGRRGQRAAVWWIEWRYRVTEVLTAGWLLLIIVLSSVVSPGA